MLDEAPGPAVDKPLGDTLELLIGQLAHAGLKIGPREHVLAAALVADLVARGEAGSFDQLRPWLAPLLARSPADRERFFQVFDLLAPGEWQPGSAPPVVIERERKPFGWKWPAVGLALLAAASVVVWLNWPKAAVEAPALPPSSIPAPAPAPPPVEPTAPPIKSKFDILNRVAEAAERFEGAPTLEELGREVAKTAKTAKTSAQPIGWPAMSYTIRLSELSGLPKTWPLALYGKEGKDGRVWALVALALDRIERPGANPTFAELLTAANEELAKRSPDQSNPVYDVAARLPDWFPGDTPADKAALVAAIQSRYHTDVLKRQGTPTPGEALDHFTIQRALAIADDPRLRRTFADAPWEPRHPSSTAPWWAAWAAALLPLALALLWFANSLTLRKAYLRRRPPELPPLHLDIVAETASRIRYATSLFQRIAQRLRQRTPQPTGRLDLEASVAATIAQGGEMLIPVYEVVRRSPEYLVLIEQRAAGDQDAQRLRELVGRLEGQVPLTVFTYRTEPSRLEPERGGRSVSIEQVQTQYPEHRLLVLGSGAEFLDPASLEPHPAARQLMHWPRRALLTPLPLAEWGREEFALAQSLQMPIGRATPEGLLTLAELLGLDGAEIDNLIDSRGDGLARPLPEVLRVRPQRFLYNAPPSDVPVPQLLRSLRNLLDGPGFDWLCGLAVYPAVQWDLTLYLGVMLPERTGGDAARSPLYREDRIAALTQLPWLREGMMPNWLRAALIAELEPKRAAEIRAVLRHLIDQAHLTGDAPRDDAVKLRISQEAAKERIPPRELLEDQVLLDFLARGRIEDFALPGASWLERFLPRGLLDRIGIPELAAGLVALAYAGAAWWVTPKSADGALLTGAWLPLPLLALGAILAVAASHPAATYRILRNLLIAAAPACLALAILIPLRAAPDLAGRWKDLLPDAYQPIAESVANAPPAWALLALAALTLPMLFLTRALAGRLGMPLRTPSGGIVRRAGLWLWRVGVLFVAAVAFSDVSRSFATELGGDALLAGVWVAAALLALFLLAWIAASFLPERLAPPKALPKGAPASWSRGALKAAALLFPIVPAAWLAAYVAGSSVLLEPIPGGATAVAELSEGGFIALGGADGIVRVYDITGEPKLIRSIPTGPAAVSGLALRRERDGDPGASMVLAASSADGRVRLYDALGGSPRESEVEGIVGEGSKALVALGPGAKLLVATEAADGKRRLHNWQGKEVVLDGNGGIVTALAAAGDGLFALATLDGQVRTVAAEGDYGKPKVGPAAVVARLPRAVQSMIAAEGNATRIAVLDEDGNRIVGHIDGERFLIDDADRIAVLSLGPAIRWLGTSPAGPIVSLTRKKLAQFAPKARSDYLDVLADRGDEILASYGINENPQRLCHFLGQVAHESGGFTITAESLNYSAKRMVEVFGPIAGIDQAEAGRLVGNPEALAERVYGLGNPARARNLGNTRTGDGYRYRGRGFLQVTGRGPYREASSRTGVDFESNPDLAFQPNYALMMAADFWAVRKLNEPADQNNIEAVTKAINGGLSGLDDRKARFAACQRIWGTKAPEPTPQAGAAPDAPSPAKPAILTAEQERTLKPRDIFRECDQCPEMIVVPAGSFVMGSPASEEGRSDDEGPQHQVTIAQPLAVGRFEVTFDEWDACVADGGCGGYRPDDRSLGRGRLPVINVSWDDAKGYVAWLSKRTGKTYRLLTEAEWEYVARAGTSTPFWWGASITPAQANYDGTSTYGQDGETGEYRARTVAVDSFEQNPWGLFNVHGNAWEWVEDCYADSYSGASSDGTARQDPQCSSRVLRGGGWDLNPGFLRSAFRVRLRPDDRSGSLGFRLARTLNP